MTGDALPPVLVTPEQAAKSLNVSRSVVYELLRAGDLRSVKIGRLRRIPTEALTELVVQLEAEEGTSRSSSEGP